MKVVFLDIDGPMGGLSLTHTNQAIESLGGRSIFVLM